MSIQSIQQYVAKVEKIIRYGGSRNESALRKPFQELLDSYALGKNLLLVTEVEVRTPQNKRIVPDGTLKDALRQDWGYWESKDEKDDLEAEIAVKFARGYPDFNILFEDSHKAVLYQNGEEVARADFADFAGLDILLRQFVSYEPLQVTAFHRAIDQFKADVPKLAEELRQIFDEQLKTDMNFQESLQEFLGLCQDTINPRVELADVREMLIQHILTEDVFMTIFDEPQFHRENAIANKLQQVVQTFYLGATFRNIRARIAPYYDIINARAAQIYNHHEKQKFLKALYEHFYRAYNPKAADRLGVIYTPDEIVRFMIQAADYLTFEHFGKTIGEKDVEILDPATGTGTFVTELIEYLPETQLKRKYQRELHCNEVAILPYYIANLNIEYTYRQKMSEYLPFENICFVDTLDNLGFEKAYIHQTSLFALTDENVERIKRQNERKISIIIGNPPYNANQLNENENNKNREYPEIDQRIKDTYIRYSTAQKTKGYDMYIRFLRWASDRLDKNGIVAFVSNNSFVTKRTHDGLRRAMEDEFNYIYVVDLKGDANTSGERRRCEGGNVFSNQIKVGVAVYFLVRKQGERACRIHYNAVSDCSSAGEKKAYLSDNTLADLDFDLIHPDKDHNWLNLTEHEWGDLIPIASKEAKYNKTTQVDRSVFKVFSLGVVTARDEWVYGRSQEEVETKVKFLIKIYNHDVVRLQGTKIDDVKDLVDYSIKWTRAVKKDLSRGKKYTYDRDLFLDSLYRPYNKMKLYFSKELNEMQYLMPSFFRDKNLAILLSGPNSPKPFTCLATDKVPDFNSLSPAADGCRVMPLYLYTTNGESLENVTDWVLECFRKRYQDTCIAKKDIFHYVYAVLHHPVYRQKYALNLKRGFPHIPFYENFRQWEKRGAVLMRLHLNYETIKPYRLRREDKGTESLRQPVVPRLIARQDQGSIEIDTITTLHGIPAEAWQYQLGTYSALEWVLQRHKERLPRDPTIRERFDTYRFADHKEVVIDLLRRVCTVSVATTRIINRMPET